MLVQPLGPGASYVKDPTPSYTTQSSPGFGPPAYVPPVLTQQPRPGMGPSGVVGAVGIAAPAPTMAPAPMRSYGYPAPMMPLGSVAVDVVVSF